MENLLDKEDIHKLQHLYESVDDIDLYVGGFLEKPNRGTSVGPTLECLVSQQFQKLKTGDRFFYTNPGQFTLQQLEEIKQQSLASILCWEADEGIRKRPIILQSHLLPKSVV